MDEELSSKVQAAFAGLPTLVVRVDTLPKNAPVELEMIAMSTKREYQVDASSAGSIQVRDKSGRLAYQCIRFDSLQSYFECDDLTGAGRVDVFMEANERLGDEVKDQI